MRLFVLSVLSFLFVSCDYHEQREKEQQEYRARITALYESSILYSLFSFVDKHPERFIVACSAYSSNWKRVERAKITDTESNKIYNFVTDSVHCHSLTLSLDNEILFENIADRGPVLGKSFEAARAVNAEACKMLYRVWLNNRQNRIKIKQKTVLADIGVSSNEADVSHTITEDSININVTQSPNNNRNIDVTID